MKYCFLFLSAVLLLNACTKVETPPSKQEQLRSGSWKVDTGYITKRDITGDHITEDIMGTRDECRKDDYIVFRENNAAGIKTGDVKCPNGQVEEIAATWGLGSADTKMHIYNGGDILFGMDNAEGKLTYFDDSRFVFEFNKYTPYPAPNPNVDTVTYTVTFRKM